MLRALRALPQVVSGTSPGCFGHFPLTGPKPTGGVNFYTYIGSTLFKWQLLKLYIYWVHRGGIMYPTLEMAKTCLKRSLFED